MKRVLLVLALVAVYGIAISNVSAKVITIEKNQVTVVADANDNLEPQDQDKKVKKAGKACCSDKKTTKKEASCSETQKKSCAASKASCCDTKKKEEKK